MTDKQMIDEITALEGHIKPRKHERLHNAHKKLDDIDWTHFSIYHWAIFIEGFQLDFWPTAFKWQFKGELYRGSPKDLLKFINKVSKPSPLNENEEGDSE